MSKATIGPTVHVRGAIRSSEDLVIEGRVDGAVQVPDACLTIESDASIDGDIRGWRVTIRGSVRGTVSGSDRIELDASASVAGDLSANHVVVVDGARFNGRIDMNRRTIAHKVARHKAEQELARR